MINVVGGSPSTPSKTITPQAAPSTANSPSSMPAAPQPPSAGQKRPLGGTTLINPKLQKFAKHGFFQKTKYILAGVGLLILIVGSVVAYTLVQRSQEIRQRAAVQYPGVCYYSQECPFGYVNSDLSNCWNTDENEIGCPNSEPYCCIAGQPAECKQIQMLRTDSGGNYTIMTSNDDEQLNVGDMVQFRCFPNETQPGTNLEKLEYDFQIIPPAPLNTVTFENSEPKAINEKTEGFITNNALNYKIPAAGHYQVQCKTSNQLQWQPIAPTAVSIITSAPSATVTPVVPMFLTPTNLPFPSDTPIPTGGGTGGDYDHLVCINDGDCSGMPCPESQAFCNNSGQCECEAIDQ